MITMALQPYPFFDRDLREWLDSWKSQVNISPERVDLDALTRDLLAHTDPLLGAPAPEESEFQYRGTEDGELVTGTHVIEADMPEASLVNVLRFVPDRRVVGKALPAYFKAGARGVRLCRFADFEDYHPQGLIVPVERMRSMHTRLRFPEWQEIIFEFVNRIDREAKAGHYRFTAPDFDVEAWAVAVFNEYGRLPVGFSNPWKQVSGAVDPWALLEDHALNNSALDELRRCNKRAGGESAEMADLDWADNNELGGLAGSNFPGWQPQR